MENYILSGTQSAPYIELNYEQNKLVFKGQSYPENAFDLYEPVYRRMDEYLAKSGDNEIIVEFSLSYINASSTKCLLILLEKLNAAYLQGKKLHIHWYCEEDGGIDYETGKIFKKGMKVPFNFIAKAQAPLSGAEPGSKTDEGFGELPGEMGAGADGPDLFGYEENLLKSAEAMALENKYPEDPLSERCRYLARQYARLLGEVRKIVRISDEQQDRLHRVRRELDREIAERARAEEKLKYDAAIDSLTGAYNRGTGLAMLESQLKAFKRNKCAFSICYVDVDGLKYVNDNFSHPEGDELLVLICRYIQEAIRDGDILCRLGGDEFLIVFPSCTEENAEAIVGRITERIDKENECHKKPYKISFSHGTVQIGENGPESVGGLIELADRKMYEHKLQYKRSV
jgi:two-component system cell cycle response regulator